MTVKYKQVEYHQVHVHKVMEVEEEDIIEQGLTVERFKEILTHSSDTGWQEPVGEEPTDEESDIFWEIVHGYAMIEDSEEDWFSDRKGGYEIDYTLLEEGV